MSAPAPPGAPPSPRIAFPHQDEFARKFFGEAVRHLFDARALHQANRYAGAITSSMKAAELGIKAVLIVDGSLGWWDKLQQTHRPLDEIQSHPVLQHHFLTLERYRPGLTALVMALENLAPSRPDPKSFELNTRVNTEYPFFYLRSGASGGSPTAHLDGPSDYFTRTDSRDHYRTAHELLTAYQTLYVEVKRWKHRLPRPL